ncbi:MAG: preprotein translocase subunit YajC [Rikenellaceae bacterium]
MITFLQVAEELVAPEPSMIQSLQPFIMIGLMILVLWLFMLRPESKRRKEMAKFREALKKGDKIVTAGGIHGTIKEVKETTLMVDIDTNTTIKIDKTMVVADAAAAAAQAQK